jgi:hypothetical protein
MNNITDLPYEMIVEIMKFMNIVSIFRLIQTSKSNIFEDVFFKNTECILKNIYKELSVDSIINQLFEKYIYNNSRHHLIEKYTSSTFLCKKCRHYNVNSSTSYNLYDCTCHKRIIYSYPYVEKIIDFFIKIVKIVYNGESEDYIKKVITNILFKTIENKCLFSMMVILSKYSDYIYSDYYTTYDKEIYRYNRVSKKNENITIKKRKYLLLTACETDDYLIVRELLEYYKKLGGIFDKIGAIYNKNNKGERTNEEMLYACRFGLTDIVRILLRYKASPTYPNNRPLHLACIYRDNYKLIKMLIHNGADPTLTNKNGQNIALYYAGWNSDIKKEILLKEYIKIIENRREERTRKEKEEKN